MTIVLHHFSGPKDGALKRSSGGQHMIGAPIIKTHGRGYYTSMLPWDGASNHVVMFWFYGVPKSHCEATDEWFAKRGVSDEQA